jgi:hypothetical protein
MVASVTTNSFVQERTQLDDLEYGLAHELSIIIIADTGGFIETLDKITHAKTSRR